MEREYFDTVGYVLASQYRMAVVWALKSHSPLTPKQISETTHLKFSHVSRALKELREKGAVEWLNPDRRKGKLYSLTDEGKKVAEYRSIDRLGSQFDQ